MLTLCVALTLLAACATRDQAPQRYLALYDAVPVSPARFVICNQPGCEGTVRIRLSDQQWQHVRDLFQPAPRDGASERAQVAQAIARMERLVGDQANTGGDQPRNQMSFTMTPQLDCVAETTNTTVYLLLLHQEGLLKWHEVGYPRHRGLLNLKFPHNTAVLIDQDTRQSFAVDSWFYANGEAPVIVPIESWLQGYDPGI